MKMTRLLVLPALFLAMLGCPPEDPEGSGEGAGEGVGEGVGEGSGEGAAQLSVERVGNGSGSSVSYAVQIDGGPSEIAAFGLDVTYDPAVLSYVGWEKGDLTQGFTQVGANAIAEDTVRVGGFTVDGNVPMGASGTLAILQFDVVGAAPEALSIQERVDDLKTFGTSAP